MPTLHLTADPGLEDLARDELLARLPAEVTLRPLGLAGHLHVTVDVPLDPALGVVTTLRTIHHIVRPVATFPLASDPLPGIRRALADLAPTLPELADDVSFRVTSARTGTHPFTSEDVARAAGAGVRDVLPRAVRMKGFDVHLRVDVRHDLVLVGVQLPDRPKATLPFRPTTTLRASVAWALLQLARADTVPTTLLDPFAGAGTILLEAAARWPAVRLHGSDLHTTAAAGLRENLDAAGLTDRAEVRQGDARRLDQLWPDLAADTVVTNPPFGRRLGQSLDLTAMYRSFLGTAATCTTPDARMVVLVETRGALNAAIRAQRAWRTVHVRVFEMGGVYVGAFVLVKN